MEEQLKISIIIPVHNGTRFLKQCLAAVKESSYSCYEIIVVDDGSTDESADIACQEGARVFQLPRRSGPAAARNFGAKKAEGDILLFIDSDVLIKTETLVRVVSDYQKHPDIVAVFGSYDDNPAEKNFLSQYRNLLHHFVHQHSKTEAVTFWAGCGAIRKDIFHDIGGFAQKKYPRPCIEDIELGYRLRKMGYRILLDKDLQVKHLKEWSLKSMLHADVFYRAVPWAKLILENQEMVNDLNLKMSQRISAGLLGLAVVILPFSIFKTSLLFAILFLLTMILFINYELFYFLFRARGLGFSTLSFPLYLLYYLYSGITFVVCWCDHMFLRKTANCRTRRGNEKTVN
jgi:glycosyltransferase involved in cell wall biosynthesis